MLVYVSGKKYFSSMALTRLYTEDMHFERILTNEGVCFSYGMVSLYGWHDAKIQLQSKVTFSVWCSYTRDIY